MSLKCCKDIRIQNYQRICRYVGETTAHSLVNPKLFHAIHFLELHPNGVVKLSGRGFIDISFSICLRLSIKEDNDEPDFFFIFFYLLDYSFALFPVFSVILYRANLDRNQQKDLVFSVDFGSCMITCSTH